MSLLEHLQSIADPRLSRTRRHDLQALLAIALCATIAGADNWVEVAEFGQVHQDWFAQFVDLPSGVASHDTFARVFRLLDAEQLQTACQEWLTHMAGQVQGVVAIDGKTVRGARKGQAGGSLHMVSAWAADMGLLLGQRKVDGKSNEIIAIPQLLQMLHLSGCIVTIDAMGCQRAIAQCITAQGADYVLSLKGNQRHMYTVVKQHFAAHGLQMAPGSGLPHKCEGESKSKSKSKEVKTRESKDPSRCSDISTGHGRQEARHYQVSAIPPALQRSALHWPGLSCIVQVVRQRQVGSAPASEQVSYYLSSLPAHTPAHVLAHSIRAHWSVENNLHWSLDVAMHEDAAQTSKDYAAQNHSLIRRMALQLLQSDKSARIGVQARRKRAGWDLKYLERLIHQTGN